MRFTFNSPPGWSRSPFPPPQRGVYLRSPTNTPSPESASILLFDAVAADGTLEEHLTALVKQSCDGLKIGKTGKPVAVNAHSYRGLSITLTLSVPPAGGGRARDEIRVYILIDAGHERLPITFIGGARSLPQHQAALDSLVGSVSALNLGAELYSRWTE